MGSRLRHMLALLLLAAAAGLVVVGAEMVANWRSADGPNPYGVLGAGVLGLGAVSALIVAILLVVTEWKR